MSFKGKPLGAQAQELVLNLFNYFQWEKENGGSSIPLNAVLERVAKALQISERSIARIKAKAARDPILVSPGKKRKCKKPKTCDLPECVKMGIRNTLYDMYAQKKHVTVKSLNAELRQKDIVLSNSSLNRTLHDIGFKFKKEGNRRALIEKPNIAASRIKFMRAYRDNLVSDEKRQVIFLDETWIFSKGNPKKSWQDNDVRSVRKPEGYEGKRFVVVHAGSRSGFVQGASLVFASKSQKEDYHGEMNGGMFLKWVSEQLVNSLEEPSLIIMDNAPYHSMVVEKMPTSSWKKAEITQWLDKQGVGWTPNMFKAELLALAKMHKTEKRYQVDELLRSYGHEVLRLPPYHCEFNAIELVWAHAKDYYNKHIGSNGYGDDKVLQMLNSAFQQCSDEFWENCVEHTETVIMQWLERERHLDFTVDELRIQVNGDTSDSDSDE